MSAHRILTVDQRRLFLQQPRQRPSIALFSRTKHSFYFVCLRSETKSRRESARESVETGIAAARRCLSELCQAEERSRWGSRSGASRPRGERRCCALCLFSAGYSTRAVSPQARHETRAPQQRVEEVQRTPLRSKGGLLPVAATRPGV